MTDKQPEALRLADYYETDPSTSRDKKAAAELRRLHAVNAELLEALEDLLDCPYDIDFATVPKAGIDAAPEQVVGTMSVALVRRRKARAAAIRARGEG